MRILFHFFSIVGVFYFSKAQCNFCEKSFNRTDDYHSSGISQLYNKFVQTKLQEFCDELNNGDSNIIIHSLSDSGWVNSSLVFQNSMLIILSYDLDVVETDTVKLNRSQIEIVSQAFNNNELQNDGIPAYKMGLTHFKNFLILTARSCYIYQVDYPTNGDFQDFWSLVNKYIKKE